MTHKLVLTLEIDGDFTKLTQQEQDDIRLAMEVQVEDFFGVHRSKLEQDGKPLTFSSYVNETPKINLYNE
jgi:hypothetical protein